MWHKLSFPCPTCDRQITIMRVSACANGDVSFEGICITCGKNIDYRTDIQKILTTCVQCDVLFPIEQQLKEDE